MPLSLAEVKEHVSTGLSDTALQRLIDDADNAITSLYGPHQGPITVLLHGHTRFLSLARPLDEAQVGTAVITEHTGGFLGDTETVLGLDDFRVWYGGRALQRISTGTNPRGFWGVRVKVIYQPVSDIAQRSRVLLDLVQISLSGIDSSVTRERVGEVEIERSEGRNVQVDRQRVLASLAPRHAWGMLA